MIEKFALGFLMFSMLLTIVFYVAWIRWGICPVGKQQQHVEGFAASKAAQEPQTEVNNALLAVMAKLKKMTGYLMDPALWKERIAMAKMTPMELARLQLRPMEKRTDL